MVCHEWASMMQVFANVWSAAPQAQASLRKLLATWTNIFPEAVLATVAGHVGGPAVSFLPPMLVCGLLFHSGLMRTASVAKEQGSGLYTWMLAPSLPPGLISNSVPGNIR